MSGTFAFHKYEGLGNDFIVIDAADGAALSAARARALCDRHFGIGADGVLLVLPGAASGVDAHMKVINADGTTPEMCGNGVRCVALHLARARGVSACDLVIDTDAGKRACRVAAAGGEATVTVDMGTVRVLGQRQVAIDGQLATVHLADAGNPHAVILRPATRREAERLGALLAVDPAFPGGTNVEFARVSKDGIELTVWERGVGLTLACGTGACATAAVACAEGLARYGAPLRVVLPGGALEVTVATDGGTSMCGPARRVFAGVADG